MLKRIPSYTSSPTKRATPLYAAQQPRRVQMLIYFVAEAWTQAQCEQHAQYLLTNNEVRNAVGSSEQILLTSLRSDAFIGT